MKHIYLFFNFIVFSIGMIANSISFFLYKKYKLDIYKYYYIFLLLFTIIYIADFLDFYFYYFHSNYQILIKFILLNVKIIPSALIVFVLPLLFLKIFQKKMQIIQKLIFSVLSSLPLILVIVVFSMSIDLTLKMQLLHYESMALTIIRIIIIIYLIILGFPLYQKAESVELILFYKALLIMASLVILFNIFGGVGNYFISMLRNINFISGHSFVYFIWNTVSICFVYWYFVNHIDAFKVKEKLTMLAVDRNITEREKEIIFLISQGFSNKDISKKLFISLSTTKTHLRNIFKKIHIRSRMELLNLLKK